MTELELFAECATMMKSGQQTILMRDDTILAVYAELTTLRATNAQLLQDRLDYSNVKTTNGMNASEWIWRTGKAERLVDELRAEVEKLTKRNELLEEWRKMDESGLTAKVEEMGMRVNKRHDIIAERKRIAEAVIHNAEDDDILWRELASRILAGEFASKSTSCEKQ